MEMFVGGRWTAGSREVEVRSPFSGEIIDTVPQATPEEVETALASAARAAKVMAALPAYERYQMLMRAANRFDAEIEALARLASQEVGKPITEARGEAGRLGELLRLAAFEGSQQRGETLPLEAQAGVKGKLGFTLRVPCGVVVAITPFNFPLLLVMHKIAPALAVGNAVILKPAGQTPLTALLITRLMLEGGLPENALQCITGAGSQVGSLLCSDPRVRKISFTGSTGVGEKIAKAAGVKKLSLELGSNCPLIVLPDADLEQAAAATAIGGYVNAGQVCISTQRIYAHRKVYGDFIDALKPKVEAIALGAPLEDATRLGSLISEPEAVRVESWLREAVEQGGQLLTGGKRNGAVLTPAIVAEAKPTMKLMNDELFGPAVAISAVESAEEALALANDSQYGLGAGIFTRDIQQALKFARHAEFGNVMINWTPLWRADLMPYGGFKMSGIGREGPRYAIEEMTEIKTIAFHGVE